MTMLSRRRCSASSRADPLRPRFAGAGEARDPGDPHRSRDPARRLPVHQLADAYDNREAAKALKGSGIAVPPLESYAAKLWDYWERNLDPDLFIDRSLAGRVKDKVVVVTEVAVGHRQGHCAQKLAEAGAKVISSLAAKRSSSKRKPKSTGWGARRGSIPQTSPTSRRAMRWSRAC